jgi:hypothetical protein
MVTTISGITYRVKLKIRKTMMPAIDYLAVDRALKRLLSIAAVQK